MGLHSAARHVELSGYFSVVATLQKQFDDLLFAWTEPNSLLLHSILPLFSWIALRPRKASWRLHLSKSHSTHVATLRQILTDRQNGLFPQSLTGIYLSLQKLKPTSEKLAILPLGRRQPKQLPRIRHESSVGSGNCSDQRTPIRDQSRLHYPLRSVQAISMPIRKMLFDSIAPGVTTRCRARKSGECLSRNLPAIGKILHKLHALPAGFPARHYFHNAIRP